MSTTTNKIAKIMGAKLRLKAISVFKSPETEVISSVNYNNNNGAESLRIEYLVSIHKNGRSLYENNSAVELITKSERRNPRKHIEQLIKLIISDMEHFKIVYNL